MSDTNYAISDKHMNIDINIGNQNTTWVEQQLEVY